MEATTLESISTISDEELDSINFAIYFRYGLDFSGYEKSSLKRRIVRIIHRFDLENVVGLWKKLLYDKDFILLFKDEISVGLTEMFRNADIWIQLRDLYLPKIASTKSKDEILKIWHAGCSTGEEVHTMSIVLDDVGCLMKSVALATDLSDNFVNIARKAEYDIELLNRYENNFKLYDPSKSIKTCFSIGEELGILYPKYKNYATYKQHNLTSEPETNEKYDIIFCRNVMIYFNDNLKMNLMKLFYEKLNDNGIFIIGFFDAMPSNYDRYFEYEDSGLKFFRKLNA
ncbi:MAG: CheR family methyltransferase [Cytophagales bacterium]